MCIFMLALAFGLQHESFKGAQQFSGFGLKKNGMLSKYLKIKLVKAEKLQDFPPKPYNIHLKNEPADI